MTLDQIKPGEFFKVPMTYGNTVFLRLQNTEWSVLKDYALAILYKSDIGSGRELSFHAWGNADKVNVELVNMEDV